MSQDGDFGKKFEIRCGITIAFFAAVLAVADLFGGKVGDDELKAVNEKASAFMWYQAKSIKENVVEGQTRLLQALDSAGAVEPARRSAVRAHIANLMKDVEKYKREKREILQGSETVGRENWVQEVNGEFGRIVGALEWDKTASLLGAAGDRLDLASLFLQLCLVIGATSLVLANPRSRRFFYWIMVGLGTVGSVIGMAAYRLLPF
ncbi:MAG: DUF4337 domain-containing protein [Calothrix sp. SM1_5_4]|nr:DUF4337 domain-containing protein [Calothrix sp. SM1_5_4]